MKKIFLFVLLFITATTYAQKDSIPSGVYSFNKAKPEKTATGERRLIVQGTSLDLASLNVHTSTLAPGLTNHPPVAYDDREELLVIKEGTLTVMLNDSIKNLEPGSVALMEAGVRQSFKNETNSPVTYFILTFKSRPGIDLQRGKTGGGSITRNWNALTVVKTDKGESRPMFIKPSAMFAKFDMHATALNPGFASHPPHTHRNEEIILMLKGKAESFIDGKKYAVEAGDIVFTASNATHNITNTGTEQCGYFAIQWSN
ncbi:MAG: cupin domain-containing protein [Chitinophagaceae bacterium]